MDKVKEIIRRIIACIVICSVFLGGMWVASYAVTGDSKIYMRVSMHEFYNQDNIDMLFVGPSNCGRSINPAVMDEKTGFDTFNLGSPVQYFDTSYLVMQEAIHEYDIKKIYVDISYTIALKSTYIHDDNLRSIYIVTDYMKPSFRKYKYLFRMTESGSYANNFFRARRDWEKLFDGEHISKVLQAKHTEEYKTYTGTYIHEGGTGYVGKGFKTFDDVAPELYYINKGYGQIKTDEIPEDFEGILYSMIALCKKNNVELTFYSSPEPNFVEIGYGNRDEFDAYIEKLLKDTGVDYIDFNLMKKEYWEDTTAFFMDEQHLNTVGAEKYSNVFADYINGDITKEELLYNSMSEKAADLDARVYGISYKQNKKINNCKIVSNKTEGIEYRITLALDDEEESVLQDFDTNNKFDIPAKSTGICIVEYRMVDNPDEVIRLEVELKE